MADLFLKLVNMSICASWLVLAIVAIRLLLRKGPKWVNVLLWGLVAVRLICPVSIESALSLIPSAQTISPEIMTDPTPQITTGVPALNSAVNPVISESFSPAPGASANPLQIWIPVLSVVWMVGMALMVIYTAVSYLRLRGKVSSAVRLRDNIYQSEYIDSPFVLGIIKPRVYLPYGMAEQDMAHVIAHEQTHIRRKDHWWKPLGFLLLTVHWFNPLMWAAYVLLCRDIELACDEKVVKELGTDQRAEYSEALLSCSVNRKLIAACPLAFGEVGVRERVKNVLSYRKPAFWLIVIAVVICLVVAMCFLTNPYAKEIRYMGFLYSQRGASVQELPEGSAIVGALEGITHRTSEHPREDFHATNLDEKYAGCEIYQSGADPYTIYLHDYSGYYIPFVTEEGPPSYGSADSLKMLTTWFDYLADPDSMNWDATLYMDILSYAGDIQLQCTPYEMVMKNKTGSTVLFEGMPIWNAYLFDLSGDGYDELCATVSIGSGIIDNRVFVYDFEASQLYELQDRGNYDYSLHKENERLFCDKTTYSNGEVIQSGTLVLAQSSGGGRKLVIVGEETKPSDQVEMIPTDANVHGIVGSYLFLEIDGENYRYERQDSVPEGTTAGALLDTLIEDTGTDQYSWEVYAVKGCTDQSQVLAFSADFNEMFLYRYSPAKRVDDNALQQAREAGYVIMEDGDVTSGQDKWLDFYETVQDGKPSSVTVVHYHTLDPETTDESYYEAYREDYPQMYVFDLAYDGSNYTLTWNEDGTPYVRTYRYLMKYTGTYQASGKDYVHYTLTNDNTVTWDDLFRGLASSQMGDFIDHYTVYTDLS